jgi:DinB superfamily
MESSSVEAAYGPFAKTLREGHFSEPAEGWNARQVGAHISMSNEMFSELADRIHGGDPASLLAYADRHGDLAGLADAVEESAARLAAAYDRLSADERDRPVPTRIWHEGQIVRDSPMSIAELILGNGDFHLAMHMEQLKALVPEAAAAGQ